MSERHLVTRCLNRHSESLSLSPGDTMRCPRLSISAWLSAMDVDEYCSHMLCTCDGCKETAQRGVSPAAQPPRYSADTCPAGVLPPYPLLLQMVIRNRYNRRPWPDALSGGSTYPAHVAALHVRGYCNSASYRRYIPARHPSEGRAQRSRL